MDALADNGESKADTNNSLLTVSTNTPPRAWLGPVEAATFRVRVGAVLPLAVRPYTVMDRLLFAEKSSLFTVSTAIPASEDKPVEAPLRVRVGAVLPLAVRAYTVTELLPLFATKSSLFTVSTTTLVGVIIPVDAPTRVRVAAVLPLAVSPNT